MPGAYFIGTLALFYYSGKQVGFSFTGPQLAGVILTVTAFIFWITSRVQLANAFSVSPRASVLVRHGIYSKLRHPVYVFSFLAFAGVCLFLKEKLLLIPLGFLLALQIFRARQEELILEEKFGEQYKEYKKSTWF